MDTKVTTYRTQAFIAEKNLSSIAYEVKRTRAIFDDSLAIPGTNRRGGWRCPPGTRYGGQITDRFGRNCGWGVSRRLANEISDLGERLENVGDRRRGRREARAVERAVRPGLVERAAGRIAGALDSPETIEPPKKPRARRGGVAPRRQARPNLRFSEERRMQREIDNPNAPRTGEAGRPAVPSRPRPAQPRARRREAAVDVVERKPKPTPVVENIVAEKPVVEPAKVPAKKAVAKKKAAVKKAPAKKKTAVKKKAAVKKAAARRITPAAGGNAEPPRLSTPRPVTPARPRVNSENNQPDWEAFAALPDGPNGISWDELDDVLGDLYRENQWADVENRARNVSNFGVIAQEMIDEILQGNFNNKRERIQRKLNSARDNIDIYSRQLNNARQAFENEPDARRRKELAQDIYGQNQALLGSNIAAIKYKEALRQLPEEGVERPVTPRPATPEGPPIEGLRQIFANRNPGYQRDFIAEKERIGRLQDFDNMEENLVEAQISEIAQAINWNREYLENVSRLDPNQRIQMPNRVAKAEDLKRQIEGVVNAWESRMSAAERRLVQLNELRLPGMRGARMMRNQSINGHTNIGDARNELSRLVEGYPGTRFNIVEHNNRMYVISQEQLNNVRINGNINPSVREYRGGLPLADELPPVDSEVARQAEERVNEAIKKRQGFLATYLNGRYGEGNSPWKEMTPAKYQELVARAQQNDAAAKRALTAWAKEMYSHPEINGLNGKKYRTVASPRWSGNGLGVSVQIQRQTPDGNWVDVGSSARTIGVGNPPSIYNNNMFITVAADKNSGIQTIYNQHAFMYAKAAGFSHIDVSAVDDGRFVWGKVGFRQRLDSDKVLNMNNEVSKFRAGEPSLIDSESDARIVEHLIGQYVRDKDSVRHIDFVMAIGNDKEGAAKKTRDKQIKDWFTTKMVFTGGRFSLDENKVVADPRD